MPLVTAADSAVPAPASTPAAPALESQQDFSESDFQAYKESENRATLDRASGKTPAKKESKEPPTAADSATADSTKDQPKPGDSATPPADTAADSAAAQAQKRGKTKEDSERRYHEITLENRELRERLERIERAQQPPPAKDQATPPGSQPAAKAEPKIDDVDEKTGQPKYKTLAEYMSARETWLEDKLLSRVQADAKKEQQARAQTEQQQIINQGWNAKVEPARKKYADFDAVALNPDLPIKAGSVPDAFVLDSEHGADVLYYLGQHPDVLDAINKTNPLRQARELFLIEQKFAKPATTSAKTASRAPAPPHEVSGQGTVPPDETDQALTDDDFQAYKASENRKALARAKGK